MKNIFTKLLAAALIISTAIAPAIAPAQSVRDLERLVDRRQDKKNEWRNIAIASGALGVLGLLKKDNTLFFAGTAGALYSAWRYEQDRKSQSSLNRARASYFSRSHFTRDGVRYNRKTVTRNGKKYYQFVRAR